MDTLELLMKAGNRAEELANHIGTTDEYVAALGLEDRSVVIEFCEARSVGVLELGLLMSRKGIDVIDAMSVAMLFGITVGYQMALIREETDE